MDSNPGPSKCSIKKKREAPALTTTTPRFELGNSSSSISQRIVRFYAISVLYHSYKRAKFQVKSVTRLVTTNDEESLLSNK